MLEKMAVVSILTSVTTQMLKKIFESKNVEYPSDVLAGLLSVFYSLMIEIYLWGNAGGFSGLGSVSECASLIFLSFLGATLGYDKAIQTLEQIKEHKLN